jgi:mRNA-degrading endonuclease RelE of RelBE toxin-antitoxin system
MRIETTRQYSRSFDSLPPGVQNQIEDAIPALAEAFGKPHAHLGLRKLGKQLYEFRVGLQWRIVFRHEPGALYLLLVGTHDEIRRFIRSLQ